MNATHEALLTPYHDATTNLVDLRQFADDHSIDTVTALYSAASTNEYEEAYLAGYHHNAAVGEECPVIVDKAQGKRGWLVSVAERMTRHAIALFVVSQVVMWMIALIVGA